MTLTLSWPSLSLAFEDAIIAVVNDELITLKDLKDYAKSTYVSLIAEGLSEEQLQAIMSDMETDGINKLIEDKLILSKANKIGLEVREALVDERIAEMKQKYGSEQNLMDALIKNGSTLTDLKTKIRDQMKIKFVIDREVRSKIYVNPQEVTEYYEKNKSQFNEDDRISLESIFIAYGDDKITALTEANKALKQIEEGKDFKEAAQEYSQAPSVGTIERGQLLPVIEEAVFNLELNDVSSLVEVDSGIYIFKLIKTNEFIIIKFIKIYKCQKLIFKISV